MEEPIRFFPAKHFAISSGRAGRRGLTVFLTLSIRCGVQMGRWVQNVFTVEQIARPGLADRARLDSRGQFHVRSSRTWPNVWGGITETKTTESVQAMVPDLPGGMVS